MIINLGIGTLHLKWQWNIGTEAKVLRVLKEEGKLSAIRYYRNELMKCNVGVKASKEYIDKLEIKHGLS